MVGEEMGMDDVVWQLETIYTKYYKKREAYGGHQADQARPQNAMGQVNCQLRRAWDSGLDFQELARFVENGHSILFCRVHPPLQSL
jgi:hypothetical protein